MKNVELFETDVNVNTDLVQPIRREQPSESVRSLAICVTLYNEPASLLQSSLESIVQSLDVLSRQNSGYSRATISIIADLSLIHI